MIKRVTDNVGNIKGKLAKAARTDDRKPKLTGVLSSRLADGQKLRIYSGDKLLGIAKVKGKKWSFTPKAKLESNRNYIFQAQVADAKGNKLGRPSNLRQIILDTKKPNLTIEDNINGTATGGVTFTFTFSEAVKGFTKSDIRIRSGTAGTFTKVNESVYRLLVLPKANSTGTIVASVGAKKARDVAGNTNQAKRRTQSFDSRTSIELSDLAANKGGFVIYGQSPGDNSGISVSSAGDVNGDGFDDLIVGASGASPNGVSSGSTYVVYGKSNNDNAIQLSDIAMGNGGYVIHGVSAFDSSGSSVSSAGDVNGDGLDDLIIGAYGSSVNGKVFAGSSYVVFGQKINNSPVQLSEIAGGHGGFVIHGESASDTSGISVSSAGDINNDGLDDLFIGAQTADHNGVVDAGISYVVYGKESNPRGNTAVNLSDIASGIGGFAIFGESAGALSGGSVSPAGDVNGDGLVDLIIGARQADPNGTKSGSSYVVFGRSNNSQAIQLSDIAKGNGGFVIHGESEYDHSGTSVSTAGDVNGDGLDDLIIGADGADANGIDDAGSSYVVFGKSQNNQAVQLSDIARGQGGFAIHGVSLADHSGTSVGSAGDINKDGLDDLIIGAIYAAPNGMFDAGTSYVVFGKSGNNKAIHLSDVANGQGGFVINGELADDRSGGSVGSAGDFNGDGFADLIVGSIYANSDAGSTYVIL